MDKIFENNQVTIAGEIISQFTFSHDVFGEGFYVANLSVSRLSGAADIIPVRVSERLFDITHDCIGVFVQVSGQFRSYNRHERGKNNLILSVFAREIQIPYIAQDEVTNSIALEGYICMPPIYRQTPLGREVADLLLAVNRPYGKSDYIPCICWGRNARFAETFEVGGRVQAKGRIQSREYQKKLSETELETRTAYEVSVSGLKYFRREELI